STCWRSSMCRPKRMSATSSTNGCRRSPAFRTRAPSSPSRRSVRRSAERGRRLRESLTQALAREITLAEDDEQPGRDDDRSADERVVARHVAEKLIAVDRGAQDRRVIKRRDGRSGYEAEALLHQDLRDAANEAKGDEGSQDRSGRHDPAERPGRKAEERG